MGRRGTGRHRPSGSCSASLHPPTLSSQAGECASCRSSAGSRGEGPGEPKDGTSQCGLGLAHLAAHNSLSPSAATPSTASARPSAASTSTAASPACSTSSSSSCTCSCRLYTMDSALQGGEERIGGWYWRRRRWWLLLCRGAGVGGERPHGWCVARGQCSSSGVRGGRRAGSAGGAGSNVAPAAPRARLTCARPDCGPAAAPARAAPLPSAPPQLAPANKKGEGGGGGPWRVGKAGAPVPGIPASRFRRLCEPTPRARTAKPAACTASAAAGPAERQAKHGVGALDAAQRSRRAGSATSGLWKGGTEAGQRPTSRGTGMSRPRCGTSGESAR